MDDRDPNDTNMENLRGGIWRPASGSEEPEVFMYGGGIFQLGERIHITGCLDGRYAEGRVSSPILEIVEIHDDEKALASDHCPFISIRTRSRIYNLKLPLRQHQNELQPDAAYVFRGAMRVWGTDEADVKFLTLDEVREWGKKL